MAAELTDEQSAMREMALEFARTKLAPFAGEWDAKKDPSARDAERGRGTGMGRVTVREELGGLGLGRFDSTIIFEALATGCPRVAAFLSIHNMAVWMIDAFGSRGFREQVVPNLTSMDSIASYCLTEPGSGSDAAALRTRAVLDGDAYVVNGEEGFVRVVTRADNSVVLRVHAAAACVSEPPATFWLALTIRAHPTMSEAFHESVLAALGHPLHI